MGPPVRIYEPEQWLSLGRQQAIQVNRMESRHQQQRRSNSPASAACTVSCSWLNYWIYTVAVQPTEAPHILCRCTYRQPAVMLSHLVYCQAEPTISRSLLALHEFWWHVSRPCSKHLAVRHVYVEIVRLHCVSRPDREDFEADVKCVSSLALQYVLKQWEAKRPQSSDCIDVNRHIRWRQSYR